jgi:hypothetical protein
MLEALLGQAQFFRHLLAFDDSNFEFLRLTFETFLQARLHDGNREPSRRFLSDAELLAQPQDQILVVGTRTGMRKHHEGGKILGFRSCRFRSSRLGIF